MREILFTINAEIMWRVIKEKTDTKTNVFAFENISSPTKSSKKRKMLKFENRIM